MSRLLNSASLLAMLVIAPLGLATSGLANDKLDKLSQSDENYVMSGKDYTSDNYSKMTQINAENVKQLKPAWSFSDGLLNGHEGTPLVINGKMYVNTPFPNNVFALDLDHPGKILWQYKPKQNPSARAVACCDIVNRGLAYWPGDEKTPALIFSNQLDGNVVALNAETGDIYWQLENSDNKVGSTLTVVPYVVKDEVIIGSSGAELGVRGYVTAYDVHTGAQKWRAYATGSDDEVKLGKDFNNQVKQYGALGDLGLKTWQGDAWKIGGGTNWGWYAYDPGTNLLYFGTGNPSPWNATMRPGDNKWTMTIFGRDVDTGEAKFGYQKTPHDEWDYAGVDVIMLSDQKDKDGKMHKLLTHPDRNGFIYNVDRASGELFTVGKIDDTMNEFTHVNFKNGQPVRNPEYGTRMDHLAKDVCPSAMGYHDQAHDSYDPKKQLFFMADNHLCMDWEPFMLPYRAGQFFVGATLTIYPGPKGNRQTMEGSGQVKAYNAVTNGYKWQVQERFAAWGGTLATAGNLVFYGTLDGFIKARNSDTGELLWKFKLPSGVIGYPMTYEHNGVQYVAIYYGVGGWPGVGLVFDLQDPTAGLGAVGAFRQLQHYTQQGGGLMVFSLNGKGPYDDVNLDEYDTKVER
ncbi:MAG: methanol/ethanol family PQQ-dependent dehydrogenase [Methylocella sp.]